MFNHVSVGIRDLDQASRFYDATLGALGYRRTFSESFGCAWGIEWPEFWAQLPDGGEAVAGNGTHVAFIAPSREAVDRFHAAALAAGGSDAGRAGPARLHARLLRGLRARPRRQQARGRAPAGGALPGEVSPGRGVASGPGVGRGDDDLDAAVLRPPARGVVARHRLVVAAAGGLHPPGVDPVRGQDLRDRRRPGAR